MRRNNIPEISEELIKSLSDEQAYKETSTYYSKILEYVKNKFGNNFIDYKESVYMIRHNITEIPVCPVCGKRITYNHYNTQNKFNNYCSMSCYGKARRLSRIDSLKELTGYDISAGENLSMIFKNVCSKHPIFTLTKEQVEHRCSPDRITYMTLCPICNPEGNKETSIETIIKNILIKHNINFEQHNRKLISPKELDFYLPNYNIAIECNGMYWHSDFKIKDNSVSKVDLCNEKSIKLLTFWEFDIIHNSEKVEDIILSAIGNNKRVYARKCVVKEIDSKTVRDFIEKYHLQGYVNSSIKLGLYYNDELVEVMTFGKLRVIMRSKSNDGEYELYRLCTKSGYTVIGGAGKLLEYFKKNYEWNKIVSYCQRDISNGNVYEKIGFSLDSICKSGFFYYNYKDDKIVSRFALRKNVVDDGSGRTADEIIKDMGYMKCVTNGNYKYIMMK